MIALVNKNIKEKMSVKLIHDNMFFSYQFCHITLTMDSNHHPNEFDPYLRIPSAIPLKKAKYFNQFIIDKLTMDSNTFQEEKV